MQSGAKSVKPGAMTVQVVSTPHSTHVGFFQVDHQEKTAIQL